MIKLSINVTRIDKARLVKGKSGTYMDAVLIERPDDYGNDGFIAMDKTKEEREAGTKTPIIGNWKRVGEQGSRPAQQQKHAPLREPLADNDSVPF